MRNGYLCVIYIYVMLQFVSNGLGDIDNPNQSKQLAGRGGYISKKKHIDGFWEEFSKIRNKVVKFQSIWCGYKVHHMQRHGIYLTKRSYSKIDIILQQP